MTGMDFQEALNYIEDTGSAGIKPGTEVIKKLLYNLGNPEKDLKVIHVAGTNGKGSVCAYLEHALLECGLKIGRYASPSVFRYLERIRLGGEDILKTDYAEAISAVKQAADIMEDKPTGFEAETAAAFWFFSRKKADIVIVECGMGGREDATNVFESPLVTVFTPVSMDHMQYLGETLTLIARNKAGIMKQNSPAVISRMSPVSAEALAGYAKENNIEYFMVPDDIMPEGFVNPLPGRFQNDNLSTALFTLKVIEDKLKILYPGKEISSDIFIAGMAKTRWPGRFERISNTPVIIRDGAHNPGAAQALLDAFKSDTICSEGKNIHLIMGVFKDKDHRRILEIMLPIADTFTAIDLPDTKRGLSKEKLLETATEISVSMGLPIKMSVSDSLKGALNMYGQTSEDIYLVFGSLSIMQLFDRV